MDDRYGTDVLAAGWRDVGRPKVAAVPAERDLVVEVAADGYVGAVTRVSGGMVELEDRHGRTRVFPLGPGYLVDGAVVTLVAPQASATASPPKRTASQAPNASTTGARRNMNDDRHGPR